jgi:hypothetical protein
MHIKYCLENPKRKDDLIDVRMNEDTISEGAVKKFAETLWTRFFWLRRVTKCKCTSGFILTGNLLLFYINFTKKSVCCHIAPDIPRGGGGEINPYHLHVSSSYIMTKDIKSSGNDSAF